MIDSPSIGNGVQRHEKLRKNSLLNYESPALTAELQALVRYETNHANRTQPRPKRLAPSHAGFSRLDETRAYALRRFTEQEERSADLHGRLVQCQRRLRNNSKQKHRSNSTPNGRELRYALTEPANPGVRMIWFCRRCCVMRGLNNSTRAQNWRISRAFQLRSF